MLTHAHSHTRSHTHTFTRTRAHSRTHTFTHTLTCSHTHPHILTHLHTDTLTCSHTCAHTHVHTHACALTHIHTRGHFKLLTGKRDESQSLRGLNAVTTALCSRPLRAGRLNAHWAKGPCVCSANARPPAPPWLHPEQLPGPWSRSLARGTGPEGHL